MVQNSEVKIMKHKKLVKVNLQLMIEKSKKEFSEIKGIIIEERDNMTDFIWFK